LVNPAEEFLLSSEPPGDRPRLWKLREPCRDLLAFGSKKTQEAPAALDHFLLLSRLFGKYFGVAA
jgi:hypothetical protein